MKRSKVQEIQHVTGVYRRLQKIAKTLHTLDENACNYELSKAQVTRGENLMVQAEELAQTLDLHAYNQSDPRGCSLYLVESLENARIDYTSGVAVY